MTDSLESLTSTELLLLQKQIQFGKESPDQMSEEQIALILQLGAESRGAEKEMKTDAPELAGTVVLGLNAIFTAILGAWMGISGFMERRLDSFPLFLTILFFCTLIGGFIGFQNFRMTQNQSRKAKRKNQLQQVDIHLLRVLNRQREGEIRKKVEGLQDIFRMMGLRGEEALEKPARELATHDLCLQWLEQLTPDHLVKDPKIQGIFSAQVEKSKAELQRELEGDRQRKRGKIALLFEQLSRFPTPHRKPQGWIQTNFRSLLVSLTPTVLGGFSSLFVYLGGAPRLAKEMRHEELFRYLSQPHIKYIELAIALCITAYFAYSFLHNNRKAFQRDQELAKSQEVVNQEQTKLHLSDDKLLKIKKIEEVLKPLATLYRGLTQL